MFSLISINPGRRLCEVEIKLKPRRGGEIPRVSKKNKKLGCRTARRSDGLKVGLLKNAGASLQECGRPRPRQRASAAAMVIVSQSVMVWPFVVVD